MKKYLAKINVMPHKELLDPQGKAVLGGLKNLSFDDVTDVRIGKRINLSLEATDINEAEQQVEKACSMLLANAVMESYEYSVEEHT